MALLCQLAGREWHGRAIEETFAEFDSGSALLEKHTVESLGDAPDDRNVRIMVTMPSEAASDPNLIRDFLHRGMNIMRINCAHDSAAEWLRMIENLQAAREETGKACKITFDLAGPKLRTGPLSPGRGIIRWKPVRNELGQVTTPAYVAFCNDKYTPDDETIAIPVKGSIFRHARAGDFIELTDTRGRERTLHIVEVDRSCCVCTNDRTGYVIEGTKLHLLRERELLCEDVVDALPEVDIALSLSAGDDLLLTPAHVPGKPAEDNEDEVVRQPAQIGCSLSAVFTDARAGERIFFDDGKIEGVIRAAHREGSEPRLEIEITQAANGTAKLRAEKGINLPDSKLNISALTPKDREDLEFATQYRRFGVPLVRSASEDVAELIAELDRLEATNTGIILKIENRRAVEDLPRILLTAMGRPMTAVMVARGDLGVEIGFERMAEIQEQILWICEAAHVPVIWATQVLESLVKRGLPSRAEVTDAAMSGRAECVMLNKGPHILLALDFLCDVLARMEGHQTKKSALMRKLSVAELAWK